MKTKRVNRDNQIDLFSEYLKCADCGKELTIKKTKIKHIFDIINNIYVKENK